MKISIITVTYNAASVLQRTLDSVKGQTCQQIEHLIIDGASKDDTISMVEAYKAQCPYEVVVLSEPDKGLYDAMNKGLRLATGDYLVFMNAGDTLYAKDTLETIVSSLQTVNKQPGVIYGDTAITDGEGKFLYLRRLRPPKQLSWKSFRQGMVQRRSRKNSVILGQVVNPDMRHRTFILIPLADINGLWSPC